MAPRPRENRRRGPVSLADLIRTQREALGMSQNQLARDSGVDVGKINRIEAGATTQPAATTLAKLAEALGLALTDTYAAASERHPAEVLPTFQPYLRSKYADLPDEAQARISRYFARVSKEHGVAINGPADGEDEVDE